ncbi:hypothetical protein EVAR_842_1 [Eumeta japonica]|uniref:Uncharacterized protein n=1 Tax=Eumeta variegata TaxID=151549 RepID=A0A4C1SGC1_EUMVA|nr:hypothetical protein EVAR_842_1 [Eumeta japonica]
MKGEEGEWVTGTLTHSMKYNTKAATSQAYNALVTLLGCECLGVGDYYISNYSPVSLLLEYVIKVPIFRRYVHTHTRARARSHSHVHACARIRPTLTQVHKEQRDRYLNIYPTLLPKFAALRRSAQIVKLDEFRVANEFVIAKSGRQLPPGVPPAPTRS